VLDGGALPDAATLAGLLEPAPTERPAENLKYLVGNGTSYQDVLDAQARSTADGV
jgi:hypothetical protein